MTKIQLLADMAAKCGGEILSTELVDTTGVVNRYTSIVFTVGAEADSVRIAQKRNVSFFVHKEGTGDEAAYYGDEGYRNYENRNPTGSTLTAIYGIFSNPTLRERVIGAVAKAIRLKMGGTPSAADKLVVKYSVTALYGLTDLFMTYVASNATIQANGGAASDGDLDYVVQTEAWSKIGSALEG